MGPERSLAVLYRVDILPLYQRLVSISANFAKETPSRITWHESVVLT